jgi:hypothetical protein
VTTAAEALARVDQQEIVRLDLWDATARRGFTALEYRVGDNSYGSIFAHGTTAAVADIHDGDLLACAVYQGPELRDCADDAACADGLTCVGVAAEIGTGSCIDLARDDHPDEASACDETAPCPAASGPFCAGLTRDVEGLCLPAWMSRRFEARPDLAIPDDDAGGAEVHVPAYGLATVDVDVSLAMSLRHDRPGDLRIFVANPARTEVLAREGATVGDAPGELELDVDVIGFSGDEEVVRAWTVRVVDDRAGRIGTVDRVELTSGSRGD